MKLNLVGSGSAFINKRPWFWKCKTILLFYSIVSILIYYYYYFSECEREEHNCISQMNGKMEHYGFVWMHKESERKEWERKDCLWNEKE